MTAPSSTAAVAEFRCLYTSDVRKKQKKWHDGFLAFHAFNRRVMVYDDARNLVGDTYCKDRDTLQEGDELTLDKGVLVELADALGVTHTDLGPLLDKKPRPPPPAPRRFQPPSQVTRPTNTQPAKQAHTQHAQPRHKSLNTLLGTPRGPIGKSLPIQSPYEARQEKENVVTDRAPKRQKTTHRPATIQLSSPVQSAPKPTIALDDLDAAAHSQRISRISRTITSRPTTTSQPTTSHPPTSRPATPPPRPAPIPAVTKPALHTPRIPRGKVPVPSVKALDTPQPPTVTSSPPVSASNRLINVDFAIQPTPVKEPVPPQNPKARSLRLSRGVKRGTLMICQPPPSIQTNNTRASTTHKQRVTTDVERPRSSKSRQAPPGPTPNNFDDDQDTIYGLMDQQLLVSVTPAPEPILIDDSAEPVRSDPIKVACNPRQPDPPRSNNRDPAEPVPPPVQRSTTIELKKPSRIPPPKQPPAAAIHPLHPDSRAASPALSTGGFRKKTKHPTPQGITPAPDPPRVEPAPLPPHPLRANKKGPVMTTTELAAMLQKPKKKVKSHSDLIEDEDAETSPSRKFRRVCSENDAPIPSTSEDWEKRNLPKPTSFEAEPTITVEKPDPPAVAARKKSGLAALIKKTDPRKKLARTQSLTVETTLPPKREVESPMASPTVDKDVGPWSTEAFDLFDWRPPRREEVET